MLDVNIHKTNKDVLALKRKKAKARTNAKKSNNTAFVRNPGVENVRVFDLGIQKLSTKNSRLSATPTFNLIKVNRYDNPGKISRTS